MSQSKLFAFTAVLLLCSLIFYQEHKMILEENKKHNFIAIQIIFIAQIWCNAILKAEIIFLNLICNWKIKGNPPPLNSITQMSTFYTLQNKNMVEHETS